MRITFLLTLSLLLMSGCMIVPKPTEKELHLLDNPPSSVQSEIQRFLPRVVAWYNQVESELLPKGRQLTAQELAFAIRLGIKEPNRIRVVVLDKFPLPDDAELRSKAEGYGMGSKAEGARMNGYVIMMKPWAAESKSVISHELVHISQQERLGREAFIRRYLIEMEIMGYDRSPLELDAYAKQSRSL